MKKRNMPLVDFIEYAVGKNIYLYGTGADLVHFFDCSYGQKLKKYCQFGIDKSADDQGIYSEKFEMNIYNTKVLGDLKSGILLITSHNFAYEMYVNANNLVKSADVECFCLPYILEISDGKTDNTLKKLYECNVELKIPKIINTFWFSGEELPELYRNCLNTWKEILSDYEIRIWDSKSYDVTKNEFVSNAYHMKKWAFVSDYARLDVINEYGGIYFDLDVEIKKEIDFLLKFDAFFSFGSGLNIDLGSGFGATKGNELVKRMLRLYENETFIDDENNINYTKYVQPAFIKTVLDQYGINDNADMQIKDNMIFLPRKYFTPMDSFTYRPILVDEDTCGIHMFNTGWRDISLRSQRENNIAIVNEFID